MGIVNVFKGLGPEREIHRFNGRIGKRLNLDWKHCKMLLGDREITKNYSVGENDVVYIREYPGALSTGLLIGAIVVGVLSAGAAVASGLYARHQVRKAERAMEESLRRIRNDNRRRDIESIPHLSGARNEFAEGKQAPIILGRHMFAPYFLSEPYMTPEGEDGEDLYWYGTFLVGQTGLNLEKLRNGTIDLASFEGNSETPSGTYRFDSPPASDGDGPPPFHDPENRAEIRQTGRFDETVFNERWEDSLESSVELDRKRKDEAGTVEDIWIEDDGPEPVIRESAGFPMRLEAEILVDGLHGWDGNRGVPVNATVELRVEWAPNEAGPWAALPGWENMTLTRNSMRQMRFVAAIDLPASVYSASGKPVYVRATRLSRRHAGGYRSRTVLSALRTRQYSPLLSDGERLVPAGNMAPSLVDKFCRIGVKIKVNENTREALDRFSVIASMTGRTRDGSRWSDGKTATSNPAAVALEVLTGLVHEPSRHRDSEIDLESLGELYDWCDSREVTVAGSGLRPVRLESCGVLTGATRKLDVLRAILATCDAGLYVSEFGKLRFWYDDFQTEPVALLNPQRIVSMTESRDLSRRLDGYAVNFTDRDGDWSERTERVLRPGAERVEGKNTFDRFSPEYVTDYYHAMWLARRTMAREILQPGEISVEVGREGRHFVPGSLIKVSHEGFRIGVGSGEIVENIVVNNEIAGIRTMERHDIHRDRDYWVDFYAVDGGRNHVVTRQIQSVGEYTDILTFTVPIPLGHDAPAAGNIVSVIDGLREGVARVWESRRCVVMDSGPTGTGYRLTLARYDDEIYRTSAIDAIPEYRSRILPSAPRVYGAVPREPYSPPPRGAVPEIGENGNWWIGGVDTGISASGIPGTAPHIGPNGNWWVGGTDTGVPARGPAGNTPSVGPNGNWWIGGADTGHKALGEDGSAPHIGANGNWWIDGVDTGIRAHGEDGKHTDYRFAVSDDVSLPPGFLWRNNPNWTNWSPGTAPTPFTVENGVARLTGGSWMTGPNPNIGGIIGRTVMARARLVGALDESDGLSIRGLRTVRPVTREWAWVRFNTSVEMSVATLQFSLGGGNTNAVEISDLLIFDGLADDWHDTPPPVDANQFLWMTRADFRGTEQLTDWSPPARITGPAGADGQTGDTGNHYALIFIRSAAQPAAPTGNTPAGWSDAPQPPDGNPLWMSRGIMNAQGVLQGTWSRPVQIEHEGRGILSVEIRFQRTDSATPPAMPPEGQWGNWLEDAPALDGAFRRLWKLERITFTSGTPATLDFRTLLAERGEDGRDGLGIDALPADAYAYWSCDDLPEIPDNPAGAVYRNDAEWTGWERRVTAGHPDTGTMTRENGMLVLTGTSYASLSRSIPAAAVIIVRARQTEGALGDITVGHEGTPGTGWQTLPGFPLSRDWQTYRWVARNDANRFVVWRTNRATVEGRMEISDLYVGDGSYLSPLLDSARDNHATMPANGGVIPTQGRFGRGLEFLGGVDARSPVTSNFFQQDFTASVWFMPQEAGLTADIFGTIDFYFRVGGGALQVVGVGNQIFWVAPEFIPVNEWAHVILKRRGNQLFLKVNNGAARTGDWIPFDRNLNIAIGGATWMGANRAWRGLIDEIVLFTRATTDAEDNALYLTALSALARYQPPPLDVRYRGPAAIADVNNTGRINGEVMHRGNFVMFTGNTVGIWTQFWLMQWDGSRWHRMPRETNMDKYLLAANDLTQNAPEAVFSTGFIGKLFADMVHVQVLNVLCQLNVGNFANGIQIDGRSGQIRGGDPDAGMGVRIESNGKATFRDMTILGDSTFHGDIMSGPLELNNRNSATPDEIRSWAQNSFTEEFFLWVESRGNLNRIIPTNGTYGNIAFVFYEVFMVVRDTWACRLYNKDMQFLNPGVPNASQGFEIRNPSNRPPNQWAPRFNFGDFRIGFFNPTGRTFKLNDLPLNEPNLRGAIWEDAAGYLRIRK